ncbi:MAG: hypothetical protein ACR2G2_02935 [Pseudonocardia sp.]
MNPEGQSGPATIGARLDRLPWSARHTTVLLAQGAGWMFDSFEVQLFSSAVGPLGDRFGASVLARTAATGLAPTLGFVYVLRFLAASPCRWATTVLVRNPHPPPVRRQRRAPSRRTTPAPLVGTEVRL